jgi:hypothetical protein
MIFLCSLIIITSCSKKARVITEGVGSYLTSLDWQLDSVSEVKTKAGRSLTANITKNLTIGLKLPQFESDSEIYLYDNYGIDSWLIRVYQKNTLASQIELSTIYVPFRSRVKGRDTSLATKAVSFALTYAAYAISERFRRFSCPAFGHDKTLSDWSIDEEKQPLEIAVKSISPYNGPLKKSELVPLALNAGHSLVGEFWFEVALLNSVNKNLYSQFYRLPITIKVLREKSESLTGCEGIHEELTPAQDRSIPFKKR